MKNILTDWWADRLALAKDTSNSQVRIYWLDCAKGIGICLVVVGHVILGLRSDIIGPRPQAYDVAVTLIYTFHMPLFFFISGLLFSKRRKTSSYEFARSISITLLFPYVLWSLIFVLTQNIFPTHVNHRFQITTFSNLVFQPIGHMWFLHGLFIVEVANFIALRLLGSAGLIVVGIVSAAVFSFPQLYPHNDFISSAAFGGTYFAVGLIAVALPSIELSPQRAVKVFIIAGLFWLAMAFFTTGEPRLLPLITAIAGITMTVALSQHLPAKGAIVLILAQLGQASLAIFVAHTICSAGWRAILYHFGILNFNLHFVTETLVGLIVPTVLYLVANIAGFAPIAGFGKNQHFLYAFSTMQNRPREHAIS